MKITIEVEFKDHRYVVLTRGNGDTYTSHSENLMDFLHSPDQPEVKNLAQPDVSGNEALRESVCVCICPKIGQWTKDEIEMNKCWNCGYKIKQTDR